MTEESEPGRPGAYELRDVMREFKTYVFQTETTGVVHGGLVVAATDPEVFHGPDPWERHGFEDGFDPAAVALPSVTVRIDVTGAPELRIGGDCVFQLDGDSLATGWLDALRGGGGCLVGLSVGEQVLFTWSTVVALRC